MSDLDKMLTNGALPTKRIARMIGRYGIHESPRTTYVGSYEEPLRLEQAVNASQGGQRIFEQMQ